MRGILFTLKGRGVTCEGFYLDLHGNDPVLLSISMMPTGFCPRGPDSAFIHTCFVCTLRS